VLNFLRGLNSKYRHTIPAITSKQPPHTFPSAWSYLLLEEHYDREHTKTAAHHALVATGGNHSTPPPTSDGANRSSSNAATNRLQLRAPAHRRVRHGPGVVHAMARSGCWSARFTSRCSTSPGVLHRRTFRHSTSATVLRRSSSWHCPPSTGAGTRCLEPAGTARRADKRERSTVGTASQRVVLGHRRVLSHVLQCR
jgi:hypothetical protein